MLIGRGKTTKDIANLLALSVGTVGTHRKSICRKLRVHSTAELVERAVTIRDTLPSAIVTMCCESRL
ncbi:hypothetical protein SBA4_5720008 [Candidatus Sulfopaludibacter sp. SbA4]|nr:hypothetical protein SBA4_5720008 [Candidatus Sulfopaludibacter sp. SbA4]